MSELTHTELRRIYAIPNRALADGKSAALERIKVMAGMALHKHDAKAEVVREATFLVERLREFEGEITDEDNARDWHGHVAPSVARMESALAAQEDT